ncbi:hypothetical protein DOTSEDRAFT_75825 [Dothistroma septosporum NZE10]|uniref:Uncharacterized protein n=1 Tax=Dothistroma septosporum (strain NZE10 / CBS 128990) TaxID=675120 RepID=N1PC91_DOTSN|nr:hypothetical protein DOTSEDRAFT_75825 [Dothistroma septosporum NZE10]
MRRETLPVYYDAAIFHIRPRRSDKCPYGNHEALGDATERMVIQRIERSVSENAKYLRHVVLLLNYDFRVDKSIASRSSTGTSTMSRKVQVIFSEAHGLKIAAEESCNTRFRVQKYQIAVERAEEDDGNDGRLDCARAAE